MIEALLGGVLALAGFHVSVPDAAKPLTSARLQYHLSLVVGVTFAFVAVGGVLPVVAPWLTALWYGGLAAVYAGHAVSVQYWGSPMSRTVFLFGLRGLPRLVRLQPRAVVPAVLACGAVAALGAWAARVDLALMPGGWRLVVGVVGFLGCRQRGRAVRRWSKVPVSVDLLAGLVHGGHGPQGPPPPFDPSLGDRWVERGALSPARRATVVVFVLDSVRAENMSLYGYARPTTPFLDSLVTRGARIVPLAVTNGPCSESGLWSILSSRRVRHHAPNGLCLQDVLRTAGFSTRAILAGLHWHSMGLEHLYGPNFDEFEDQLIDSWVVERVERLPDRSAPGGDFLFFHLMSAHTTPGADVPEVWSPALNRMGRGEGGTLDDAARAPYVNHYDNSLRQADDYVRTILDMLAAKGYMDDALVVVTADHGDHVLERSPALVGHGRSLHQESIRIPLLVWDTTRPLPEAAPLADLTDVAPTVVALLGLDPPAAWQGRSIFDAEARQATHVEHISHRLGAPPTHMEACVVRLPEGTFKTIRHRQRGEEVRRQTFCLTTDPGETDDLTGRLTPAVEAALARARQSFHDEPALVPETTWKYVGGV